MYNGERRPKPKRIWSVFEIGSGFDPEPDEFKNLVDISLSKGTFMIKFL